MQDKRQPFGGTELVVNDQQRQTHRLGEHRLLLGISGVDGFDDRIRDVRLQRHLAAGGPGPKHVQADPSDDGGEPAAKVPDGVGIGAAQPQPRLLHGILGLGQRAEHAVRDRTQVHAVLLEAVRQKLALVHPLPSAVRIRHSTDGADSVEVTRPAKES